MNAAAAPAVEREVGQAGEVVRNLDADRFEPAGHAARQAIGDAEGKSALRAADVDEPDRALGGVVGRVAEHPCDQGRHVVLPEEPLAQRVEGTAEGVENRFAPVEIPGHVCRRERHRKGFRVVHHAASQRGGKRVECKRARASPVALSANPSPLPQPAVSS